MNDIPAEPYSGFDAKLLRLYRDSKPKPEDALIGCPNCGAPILFINPSQNDLLDKKMHYLRRCHCPITDEQWASMSEKAVRQMIGR